MVDLTKAVQWWQEEQLRILVLGSVAIQLFLLASTSLRKFTIPPNMRRFIWLAFLGSDALAIYALATLFNNHKEQGSNSLLVLLWAPILLMHLGGHGDITAYNIEDNELWLRLVVNAWSHITVAIYVLCKSWPARGDKLLLWATILLFLQGANECVGKSYRLRFGSVEGLVIFLDRKTRTSISGEETHGAASLDNFVRDVRYYISSIANKGDAAAADATATNNKLQSPHPAVEDDANKTKQLHHHPKPAADDDANNATTKKPQPPNPELANAITLQPFRQTLDLLSPYTDRLDLLKHVWRLSAEKVHDTLKRGLSDTFDAIYTGRKISLVVSNLLDRATTDDKEENVISRRMRRFLMVYILNLQLEAMIQVMLPLTALVLFHKSHKEDYSRGDVKVTYALFACTAVCHLLASLNRFRYLSVWPAEVAQYGLAAFFLQKQSTGKELLRWLLRNAVSLVVKNWRHVESILKPLYSMDRRGASSSRGIIKLVLTHLKGGWVEHIRDAAGYRRFNDQRGQLTLTRHQCRHDDQILRRSLMVPLDESVLLWHVATDMCFFYSESPEHQCGTRDAPGCAAWCTGYRHHHKATRCREMSNYMVHLLCENQEMLMAGARRNLFTEAYKELVKLFKDGDDKPPPMEERRLTQAIIAKVKVQLQEGPTEGADERPFIHDAWKLAQALLRLRDGDDDGSKMWEVIQGVWVEMLCFSAGRCRGFLHAKSLATGGELLNYIWLLMSYMGMETLVERMQRPELSSSDDGVAPRPSEIHKGGGGAGAGGSAPSTSDIHIEVKTWFDK